MSIPAPYREGAEAVASREHAPSRRHCHCERCQAWVLPMRPHWGWRVAEVSFWLSCVVALWAMKGLGVVGIPFLFLFAGGLAGPLRALAGADVKCPACGCFLPD